MVPVGVTMKTIPPDNGVGQVVFEIPGKTG